ncbi:3'(2'),5'-bisphosphate nucleotidase CysQ [Fusibacter ferrireducens]|uniref:3'(2'),5'-bisphosphate nucleotidase CysQ n=1 Tax=Fusibacter ferrireducens TaxID=2785058 RepID=A0ABR9ZXZ7_9FIRM|nr:3'(2'),5'-bisphosphate nucleotidase CysQ [Fusibacter ferrireducens]MBF4695332.1 3'(2'),5'-bisphosphate nucleotidase CysQ [Fusibacter ferrireducens]
MDYKLELKAAIEAAKCAGEKILEIYRKDFKVCYKADESPVTDADIVANTIIESVLRERFPDDGFLTEESVDDDSRFTQKRFWIIDPLDGTKEFVKKNGEFAVNIGLVQAGQVLLGVVYAPFTKTLFYAVQDCGAYQVKDHVEKRIHVSDRIDSFRLLISRSHPSKKTEGLLKVYDEQIQSITKMGSSLKGCLIANGEYDVYYNFGRSMKWDTCAVECIVKEAGGIFMKLDDHAIDYMEESKVNHGFYIINRSENKIDVEKIKAAVSQK